jgi:hypothetical protein
MARRFSPVIMLAGVALCSFPLPGMGRSGFSSLTCPSLPETALVGQVSIYVARVQDSPGFACVRVINGRSDYIGHGAPPTISLQRWEEEQPGQPGQFQSFPDVYTHPGGFEVQQLAVKWYSPPGAVLDEQVPMFQPAPPGWYRVCFRYEVQGQEERGKQEVCSEGFSLP